MNRRYNSIDRFEIRGHSPLLRDFLNLGRNNIIIGPKFDIKNYLSELDKKSTDQNSPIKSAKFYLNPISSPKNLKLKNISMESNNIISPKHKKSNYYTINTESNVTHRNKLINRSTNSYKNIYSNIPFIMNKAEAKDNNCFLTSVGIEKNKINKYNNKYKIDYLIPLSPNNKSTRLYNYKNNFKNNLRVSEKIKQIREKYRTRNEKDIKNDYIAYTTENIDAVLEAKNLLNNYWDKNEWDLKLKENNFNQFSINNKNICKQNVLTKLINKEREKIFLKEMKYKKILEDKKNLINNRENIFEDMVSDEKHNFKVIEDYKYKLEEIQKEIFYLKDIFRYKIQNREVEILKKLFEIEELRGYAIFVNNMLGKDVSRYLHEIYPSDYEKKIVVEDLVKNCFEVYSDFLDDNYNIDNKNDANNPEIIYDGFKGLEDKIRYGLQMRIREDEEIKQIKKDSDKILNEIKSKINFLEEEYNTINEECNNIKDYISNHENEDKYIFLLAQELFIYILETFSYDNIYKYKNKNNELNLYRISELAKKSIDCISEKEIYINKTLTNLEKYEQENNELFREIIGIVKDEIILQKQIETKELNKIKESIKKINALKKLQKISFIIRKVEKPFHIKKEIINKIDPQLIKENEDKELLTYQ